MAEVWRGRHVRSGRGVAIKVLTQRDARSPEAVEAFRAEVRSAAGLDHPQIALVLDYGSLPAAWEDQTQGRLRAGSPFLVTEQARGGDLRRWVRQPPTWPALRQALEQLLDALAFAHARGVVHRDLKPSNVLLGTRREQRHGVLLSDFGIAHRLGVLPEPGFRARAGTPTYMAPEQIDGDWRAYGPWTDLDALGVLTWTIVQGEAPTMSEHPGLLDSGLEWHPPRMSSPPGLARWLARLLREDPNERFQRASDAAAALQDLFGELSLAPLSAAPVEVPAESSGDLSIRTRTVMADATQLYLLSSVSNHTMRTDPGDIQPLLPNLLPSEIPAPRLPPGWRPRRPPALPLDLVDAGLGLYGLRERTLVGREEERDLLWARLVDVFQQGRPAVVLVSGALGTGKSRLLRWLCERAEETGVALAAPARLGAEDGLSGTLRRALRADGLSGRALAEHLRRAPMSGVVWSDEERAALMEVLDTSAGGNPGPRTPGERYAPVLRSLRRLAGPRALVLALDDADADLDAPGLARHLLQLSDAAGPVLLVLATRDDTPEASSAGTWGDLPAHPGLTHLSLGPLPPADGARLACAGLCLGTALAERVAERAAGNPLFAALLVEDWVRQGALVVGPTGFVLRPGYPNALPESVSALVAGQIAALEASRSEVDLRALELAAVLGLELDLDVWATALTQAALTPEPDLLDVAMGRRLLRSGGSERRVAFGQNMVREALLARAAEAGRLPSHHRAAAAAVEAGVAPGPERSGRLGRHRLAAGDVAGAIPALLAAAKGASLVARFAEERALLDLVEQALAQIPEDQHEAVLAQVWALRGHMAQAGLGDRAEARDWLERAVAAAERTGQLTLLAETQRRLGGVIFELGDVATAVRILRGALELALAQPDPLVQAVGALDLCTVLRHSGAREEGETYGRLSREIATKHGLEDMIAINAKHSWYIDTLPTPEEKRVALRAATAELARLNIPGHLGAALNSLALLELQLGDPDEAERVFRTSLRVLEETGASLATLPRYNIAHRMMETGQIWDAWPLFRRCLQDLQTHRWVGMEPVVRSAIARIELLAGDAEACDAHLAQIEALWLAGGAPAPDAARNLEGVASAALDLGDVPRARAALTLAARLYEAARASEDAARVTARCQELPAPAP